MKPILLYTFILSAGIFSFKPNLTQENKLPAITKPISMTPDTFNYYSEQFADVRILRYDIPGFDRLSLKQKELLYYLSEAALAGRDIFWDQNYKYNLTVRKTLEAIVSTHKEDDKTEQWQRFLVYAKRVWFSNGIHHHYANTKLIPEYSKEYFSELIQKTESALLPLNKEETKEAFVKRITPIIFDPAIAPKKVNLDAKQDLVKSSAINFYEGVTEKEVTDYYKKLSTPNDKTPVSYGLNSKVVKENGEVVEKTWKIGGLYSPALERIVFWLKKAEGIAENDAQKKSLRLLIECFKTGDLKKYDEYWIAWVADTESMIDVTNGFIEVYNDPLGRKGSFESVVSVKDIEASKRIKAIGSQAQWFEDNSPIQKEHKKENVKGISARVITVVQESGDAAPSTPIGINLPNSNWIRQDYGSKSVNLGNIVYAYDKARPSSLLDKFYIDKEANKRVKEYGAISDALHTDMHEVIGHASGKINPGVGDPSATLKNYASTLEEARADLVALYYMIDPKLIELGVLPTIEAGKSAYDEYITNGLLIQLARIKMGENIEEAHMRNRQMIAAWVYEKGKLENVISIKKTNDGKTYYVINDYNKLRNLFGQMLKEIQRIKSEGDYEAGKNLVENYGVKVNPEIHKEVLARYAKVGIAPYAGFIQPRLTPVVLGGKITAIEVSYPDDFVKQMLEYGRDYSFLPVVN